MESARPALRKVTVSRDSLSMLCFICEYYHWDILIAIDLIKIHSKELKQTII